MEIVLTNPELRMKRYLLMGKTIFWALFEQKYFYIKLNFGMLWCPFFVLESF